ncbi:MAG TPA: efflux RND transporter periplasmic adaptor subunit, partial [Cytophagaceae bacterium]|nr:efflux RND transporter periplasmic adaptor subunit [Cytophagaceae bacterium]
MKRKIIIISIVVVVLALIGIRLFMNKKTLNQQSKPVDRSTISVPVTTTKAFVGPVSGKFSVPAIVEPYNSANISINASGKLKSLNIELGNAVTKGQVLGSVDNSVKLLNLESSQLLADKYQLDFQRQKDLFEGKATTEVDFNNAKYNYENAKTQVALIKQQIADGNVIAPISGIITNKNVEEGEFVNLGTAIATVVDISKLQSFVMVSEKNVYSLKKGTAVVIHTDVYPDKLFKGTIKFISPNGDDSHNYEVGINVDNDKDVSLKGGTFILVDFDIKNTATALQIPKVGLVEGIKNPYV